MPIIVIVILLLPAHRIVADAIVELVIKDFFYFSQIYNILYKSSNK
jgi:hypothetical protein